MREAILKLLAARPATTFVELCREIPGFRGDLAVPTRYTNVILWNGISREAQLALLELQRDEKIQYRVTNVTTYLIDGETLSIQAAARLANYKTLRWLPVTLHLVDE